MKELSPAQVHHFQGSGERQGSFFLGKREVNFFLGERGEVFLYVIDHSPLGLFRANETTEMTLAGKESQLAGGRPVGYVQAQPRS